MLECCQEENTNCEKNVNNIPDKMTINLWAISEKHTRGGGINSDIVLAVNYSHTHEVGEGGTVVFCKYHADIHFNVRTTVKNGEKY